MNGSIFFNFSAYCLIFVFVYPIFHNLLSFILSSISIIFIASIAFIISFNSIISFISLISITVTPLKPIDWTNSKYPVIFSIPGLPADSLTTQISDCF